MEEAASDASTKAVTLFLRGCQSFITHGVTSKHCCFYMRHLNHKLNVNHFQTIAFPSIAFNSVIFAYLTNHSGMFHFAAGPIKLARRHIGCFFLAHKI